MRRMSINEGTNAGSQFRALAEVDLLDHPGEEGKDADPPTRQATEAQVVHLQTVDVNNETREGQVEEQNIIGAL